MTDASAPDELPERIGGYRLGRKLGEGGMGAVYLAEHELLGRHAAIKLLHDRYARRDEIVERFFNEARAATAIADPGIVQVFDFGQQDGRVYIVMELLEGEMLDARVDRLGKLPVEEVLRVSRQLALSLYAAHQRGVVHRDLKPENIVIVSDAEAASGERTKILDFGIAKLLDADQSRVRTQTGLMMGTPHYMSPEQCRGSGSIDHRADVYSLGCLMFHLLTGETVFTGEGAGDLVVSHVTEAPRAPSSVVFVPPQVDAIVARCLAKAPDDRFPTMRQLALDIDAALRNVRSTSFEMDALTPIPSRSMIAMPAPSAETVVPARRARRWPWIAGAGALALGAALVGAFAMRGDDAKKTTTTQPPPAIVTAPPPAAPTPVVIAPTPPPPTPVAPVAQPRPSIDPTAQVPAIAAAPAHPVAKPPAHVAASAKLHPAASTPPPAAATVAKPAPSAPPSIDPYADR